MYLITSDVQLKYDIAFAYVISKTSGNTTEADWVTAKVVETDYQEGNDVEIEEGADVLGIGTYFIFSKIPEE